MSTLIGTRIGPYTVTASLGEGGMGEVYKARDTRLDRDVAVKILPAGLADSPDARDRFEREARVIAGLQHPNICTVYDVGEMADGQAFLVMELLQGETLAARLARSPLDPGECIEIGLALADALDAAHAAGIVHRDIKPSNIVLTGRGPKIIDFGVAKLQPRLASPIDETAAAAAVTEPGRIVGTVAYMSPEQLRGEAVDARSDLFSLGLVLYEMAAGRPAFTGGTSAVISAAILWQHAAAPSSVRPGLPARLDDVVLKAIEKDRELRYQHAGEIRADLQRLKRDTQSGYISASAQPPSRRTLRRRWMAGASAAVVIMAAAGYALRPRGPTLTGKEIIVLADFTNATGDAVFDGTLRQGLAVQLQQSPYLILVSDDRIQQTLRLMGQPAGAPLTIDRAREVCERTGSNAVLEGSIAALGSTYVLGLRARQCTDGAVLDEDQLQAARKEDVLGALGRMATAFRTRVGESLDTIAAHNTPLEEATTSSLEALKALSMGLRAAIDVRCDVAMPLLRRATELDDRFATAYAHLGLCQTMLGESVDAIATTTRAYELRNRTTDREKLFISALYHRQVTGNLQEADKTFEVWTRTYPRDPLGHGLWSGFTTEGTGRYDKTIVEANEALALDPSMSVVYTNIAFAHLYAGRLEEVDKTLQRAAEHKVDIPQAPLFGYLAAFLRGDEAAMARVVDQPPAGANGDLLLHLQALALARNGRLQLAAEQSSVVSDRVDKAGGRERAALFESAHAVWEGFFGRPAAARASALRALEWSRGRDVAYAAAFALALSGDVVRTKELADDLARRFPEDTSARFTYVPTLRALIAMHDQDFAGAVAALEPARATETHVSAVDFFGFFGGLYPVYVRGLALAAAGEPARAAAEFEKVLAYPGVVLTDPVGALARRQLAKTWLAAGQREKARSAYREMLTLWKNADAGVPVVEQVRREAATAALR